MVVAAMVMVMVVVVVVVVVMVMVVAAAAAAAAGWRRFCTVFSSGALRRQPRQPRWCSATMGGGSLG